MYLHGFMPYAAMFCPCVFTWFYAVCSHVSVVFVHGSMPYAAMLFSVGTYTTFDPMQPHARSCVAHVVCLMQLGNCK